MTKGTVGHVVQVRAAVPRRHVRPEDAQLGHLRDQLGGEAALDVALADHRQELLVDPLSHGVADV